MNLRVIAVVGFVCVGAAASASADAMPPPVESMSCEQMTAELVAAGQKMNSQMDPEFAQEAQAMANDASGAGSAGSMIGGIGSAVACSLPGIGMLCRPIG